MNRNAHGAATPADLSTLCRRIAARCLPLSLAALGFALGAPAQAAVINVTAGAADVSPNGDCSLAEAILSADGNTGADTCTAGDDADAGGDIIQLPANAAFTLGSSSAAMGAGSKFSILGSGNVITAPRGLFSTSDAAADITLSGLTITGGGATNNPDGPLVVHNGKLTVVDSEISGNTARGGAIYSIYGNITVLRSTIAGNTNARYGAGAGITAFEAALTVENSTITANLGPSAAQGAGGIVVAGGVATIINSTIADNLIGAGITAVSLATAANVTIQNSIVAGNAGGDCVTFSGAYIYGVDANLSSDATCAGFSIINTDPQLGALADNGGPTRTLALLAGSTAIDAATGKSTVTVDQRGVARPQFAASDLGAYELAPVPDTTPDAFNFPNVNDVPVNTPTTSKVITLSGFNTPTAISVNAGEYSFDGKSWSSAAGTMSPGAMLQLRLGSSKQVNTAKSMTVTVGGVSDTFGVKTTAYAGDVSPDDFHIVNSPGVAPNTPVTSRAIVPVGYDSAAPVTVSSGCFYIINNGTPGNTTGTILPTQTLKLRKQSPVTNGTQFQCDVTVGSTKVRWIGKTAP